MRMRRVAMIGAAIAITALTATSVTMVSHADERSDVDFISYGKVFDSGDRGYHCFRIPAIVKDANGDLLAFAEARKTADCGDHGKIHLVQKRSTNDGRTWKAMKIINDGDGQDWGNPVPILDRETGRLALLSVVSPDDSKHPRTPMLQTSQDNGHSWSKPRSLEGELSGIDWKHFATGPGGGIQLSEGDHAGRMVAGVNYSTSKGNGAGLIYSDDGGLHWQWGARNTPGGGLVPQELSLLKRDGGGIFAVARDNGAKHGEPPRDFAISTDGGDSFVKEWQPKKRLQGTTRVQGSVQRVNNSDKSVFVAPTDGRLRKELTVRTSSNGGSTWQRLDEDFTITNERAGYSDITNLNHKWVGVIYEGGDYPNGDANDALWYVKFDTKDL